MAFPERVACVLSGILVSMVCPVILLVLPSIETPGQTKGCTDCGRIIDWKSETCPWCGGYHTISLELRGISAVRCRRCVSMDYYNLIAWREFHHNRALRQIAATYHAPFQAIARHEQPYSYYWHHGYPAAVEAVQLGLLAALEGGLD